MYGLERANLTRFTTALKAINEKIEKITGAENFIKFNHSEKAGSLHINPKYLS